MKSVMKRVLVASTILATALTAGIFTACKGAKQQDEKKKDEGYSCTVTYDANGGTFGSNSSRTYTLVKENSLTPAPGYVDAKTQASVKIPTRRNFKLIGEKDDDGDENKNEEAIATQSWFLAETDEDGNVVYEGEGENRAPKLAKAEAWDFTKDKVTEDITLVAMWSEVFRYSVIIAEEKDGVVEEKEFRIYEVEPGTTIVDKLYKKKNGEIVRRADYINVKYTGVTLLDFYLDADYETALSTDYVHPGRIDIPAEENDGEATYTNTVKIYAKYLKGSYNFISQDNIRNLTESANWYFVEDVDMTGKEMTSLSKFSGDIIGNGFTMKNLTVTSFAKKDTMHSIFGAFGGKITDLTFENVTMKVTTEYQTNIPGEQMITFFAKEFTSDGALKNVTFKDCKILVADAGYYEENTQNGMWITAPDATQLNNVVMTENGSTVENYAIKIETVE